jgi:hypothetical protein
MLNSKGSEHFMWLFDLGKLLLMIRKFWADSAMFVMAGDWLWSKYTHIRAKPGPWVWFSNVGWLEWARLRQILNSNFLGCCSARHAWYVCGARFPFKLVTSWGMSVINPRMWAIALPQIHWCLWPISMNWLLLSGLTKVKPSEDPCACFKHELWILRAANCRGDCTTAFGFKKFG